MEAKIVIVNAIELKPGKKYLICIDRNMVDNENAYILMEKLKAAGMGWAVGLMTDGDPTTAVKIIEE